MFKHREKVYVSQFVEETLKHCSFHGWWCREKVPYGLIMFSVTAKQNCNRTSHVYHQSSCVNLGRQQTEPFLAVWSGCCHSPNSKLFEIILTFIYDQQCPPGKGILKKKVLVIKGLV